MKKKLQDIRGPLVEALAQSPMLRFLGRLRHGNAEVVGLRKALQTAENQVALLRIDNDALNTQLDQTRAELREGLRGTRSGGGTKG